MILPMFVFTNPIIQYSGDSNNHVDIDSQSPEELGDQSSDNSLNLENTNKLQISSLFPRQNSESVCSVRPPDSKTKTPTSQQSEEQQPNTNEAAQDEIQNPCDQHGDMDKILTCTGPEVLLPDDLLTVANCIAGKFSSAK